MGPIAWFVRLVTCRGGRCDVGGRTRDEVLAAADRTSDRQERLAHLTRRHLSGDWGDEESRDLADIMGDVPPFWLPRPRVEGR
jgi:hypothetical protein